MMPSTMFSTILRCANPGGFLIRSTPSSTYSTLVVSSRRSARLRRSIWPRSSTLMAASVNSPHLLFRCAHRNGTTALPADVDLPGPPPGGERRPLLRREREPRALRVLGVTHGQAAIPQNGNLHAVTTVATAVAALAPHSDTHVHRSSAIFSIKSRELLCGSASARTRSNADPALSTSEDFSIV